MGKKEDAEKARAIAEIEAKFAEPEYKGEKIFSLIGICSAGIIIAISIMQLYNIVKTEKISTPAGQFEVTYYDRIKESNPLTSFAPFFWTLSTIVAGFVLLCAELKFERLISHFEMMRRPVGKGIYCIFLATFYVNDTKDSYLFILNIVIAVLGCCYIIIGLCCKKKNEIEVVPTSTK